MKHIKRFLAVILCVSLFLSLVNVATAEEKIVLRFSWWGDDARHAATEAAIDAFETRHPNVEIQGEYQIYSGYQNKMMTQLASGTLPDMLQVDQPWIGSILLKTPDAFLNLSDYADIIDFSVYGDDIEKYCTYDGVICGIPFAMNTFVMAVNKTMMKEAGIEMDDQILTWDEMLEYGKQINAYNSDWHLDSNTFGNMANWEKNWLVQHTGADDFVNAETFTLNFTAKDLEEYFTWLKSYYEFASEDPEVVALYNSDVKQNPARINGNLVMAYTGPHDWASTMRSFPDTMTADDFTYVSYPMISADVANSGIDYRPATMCAVAGNTKYPELCCEFLNELATQMDMIDALGLCRGVPGSSIARERLVETGVLTQYIQDMLDFGKSTSGKPFSWVSTDSELTNISKEYVQYVAFGEMTPAEAAKEAVELYEKRLEEIKADVEAQ